MLFDQMSFTLLFYVAYGTLGSKRVKCRFNFEQFFTNKTIFTEPIPDNLDVKIKSNVIHKQKEILPLGKKIKK